MTTSKMEKDADTGKPAHGHWGGYDNDFGPSWWQVVMIFGSPLFVFYVLACGLKADFGLAVPEDVTSLASWIDLLIPQFEFRAVKYFFGFFFFQCITYYFVPGYLAKGPVTPAGNMQQFKINSLTCWFVNVVCFYVFGVHAQLFDADYPSRNIGAMYNVATVFGVLYSIGAYIKGRLAPTNSDAAFRGDWPQDFFLGIELSPRLPFTSASSLLHQLDSKLFTIGHCGMISWTIMNLSHAARMYKDHNGEISMAMILVNIFQAIYTVDWAWKEVWYLYTIDMRHDRLGFYLGWGSLAWLPVMYCLQAWYLSLRAPSAVVLSQVDVAVIVGVFLLGMTLFRLANNQKDEFRAAPSANIWGAKPSYIEAKYSTGDGKTHTSLLLCSGYWGVSRHFNYLSDLFICLSFSLPCRSAVLPYFYLIYMFALLLHRSIRDDRKCRAKYGEHWDKYCERVPYVLVPYVY